MTQYTRFIIFDWAGTIVDAGSKAPLYAFRKTFEKCYGIHGNRYSDEEINRYMGMDKFQHLLRLTRCEKEASQIYPILIEEMKSSVRKHSQPIPGINFIMSRLHEGGYHIGSTSGYPRVLLDEAIYTAKEHGMYIPYTVASDEVNRSRPYPDMMIKNIQHFNRKPTVSNTDTLIIKVGDTPIDMEEGVRGGAKYRIGIANDKSTKDRMWKSGATHVINIVHDLLPILKLDKY